MPESPALSPLAVASLGLVGRGASPTELTARFAAAGAVVSAATAHGLLDELAGLGLVRVARKGADQATFVLTSLGQHRLAAMAGARGDDVELLRELERMRTDLLSTIAHELRTPLTAVRTSVGILRDSRSDPTADQRSALLETIERNADRMQRVVGDILDLTRYRAGRVQLQLRRFDAVALARAAVASFPPTDRPVRLDAPSHGVPVFGDRRRLEQALVNLVSNARKYSPPDAPVTVTVGEIDGIVRWAVADRGVGIPATDQARLFERFFVGRGDRSGPRDGVGLGLPIALAIVQAHGGGIDVESSPGIGSTFTMSVPAAGPEQQGDP
jgi:signal transduction histidine kinase